MIVFKKKNKFFLLILLILFLILYLNLLSKKTLQTFSTPITKHIIILDAGHGYPDGGAVSNDGTIESNINIKITLALQELLESANCTVILTRSDENGIYDNTANTIKNKKISDMKNRAFIANNSNAEIFISIHLNKINKEKYFGYQTFYKNNDSESKKIASFIQSNLNEFIKIKNSREIKSISNIYLTKNVNIPLVLVECGFLSNNAETNLLKTEEYQNKLAWSIFAGLMDYFNS